MCSAVVSVFAGPGPYSVSLPYVQRNLFTYLGPRPGNTAPVHMWNPKTLTVPIRNMVQDITVMVDPQGNWQTVPDYTPDEGTPWTTEN